MVAGRLQEKNGFYYIVLSYTDSAGKRRQPWIGTGLPVKGNKKRAEKMLADTRKDFTIPKGQVSELSPDMAFSDYMRYWLKMMRTAVTETTYSSYCFNVEKHIIPYFEPLGVTLAGLQPRQIQSFYLHEAETLKNTSILRFHANLHKALKYAVRIDLIRWTAPSLKRSWQAITAPRKWRNSLKQPKAISWNLSSSLQPFTACAVPR